MHKIKIVIGDPSNDGHGVTESFLFNSNKSLSELKEIYKINSEALGFDLMQYCHEYEDSVIPKEVLDPVCKLLNFDITQYMGGDEFEDGISYDLYVDLYVDLFIAILQYGTFGVIMEQIKETDGWDIGGYGLFE